MEQKYVCASICDALPTLSANHPWLVDHNLQDDHIVYTMRDPPSQSRCRIPSFLVGRRIWGCFYGWVIFSNHPHNDIWSLWNPVTSNIIRLPRLISKNKDQGSSIIRHCCLSSPPDDHGSIFMVKAEKYAIVFCRLDCKRKRLKWVEMSYAKQMRSIMGYEGFLHCLTCCNGKVYALNSACSNLIVVHIDILVKGRETVISLLPYLKVPSYYMNGCPTSTIFLKGCCTELFYIKLGHNKRGQVKDLKEVAFFLDFAHGSSVFYIPAIASELGGYVHFLDRSGKVDTHST